MFAFASSLYPLPLPLSLFHHTSLSISHSSLSLSLSLSLPLFTGVSLECCLLTRHLLLTHSLLSPLSLSLSPSDGDLRDHTSKHVGFNQRITNGSTVAMEVDVRESGMKRTLRFFINGVRQKEFVTYLPETVAFCVCIIHIISITIFSHLSLS